MQSNIAGLQYAALAVMVTSLLLCFYMLWKFISSVSTLQTTSAEMSTAAHGSQNILTSFAQHIQAFGRMKLTRQRWLHLGTSLSALLLSVSRLPTSLYGWNAEYVGYTDQQNMFKHQIFSTFFSCFLWMTILLYTLAVIDRYKRVMMVIPKTWSYAVLRCVEIAAIVFYLMVILANLYSKSMWILGQWELKHNLLINGLVQLAEVLGGIFCPLLEIILTMRMVITALHFFKKKIEWARALKRTMLTYYVLLLFFDFSTICLFSLGNARSVPNVETRHDSDAVIAIATSCLVWHVYFGFKLLDTFLLGLQSSHNPSDKNSTNRSDVVSAGLYVLMTEKTMEYSTDAHEKSVIPLK